jgi:O-acetylserine/cysteine efflux transporter
MSVPRLAGMTTSSLGLRHALLATLVAVIWGFNFVVIDWGMPRVPPLLFLALRFTAVVVPAVFLVPRPSVSWRTVVAVGVFMSLGQFGLLYTSMYLGMPPGLAALVLQAQVVFTVVIAAAWLRERPTPRQVLGILAACAGLVVVGVGRGGHIPLAALLLCLGGALSWGIGNVVVRRAAAPTSSGLSMVVWSSLVVPVPALALSLVLDGPRTVGSALAGLGPEALVSTVYTAGLASLVGYAIFNNLLARYPASSVVPFVLIAPPVAMVSAWLLLGQVPNVAESFGGLAVLVGVLVTVGRSPRQGRMLKFRRNTLSGSQARLTSVSLASVAGGQRDAMSSAVSDARNPAYDPIP